MQMQIKTNNLREIERQLDSKRSYKRLLMHRMSQMGREVCDLGFDIVKLEAQRRREELKKEN